MTADRLDLQRIQSERMLHPNRGVEEDYKAVYLDGDVTIGWPDGARRIFDHLAREHTIAIVGVVLGDEGKGRFVDNKLESLLQIDGVMGVHVIRYSGGGNAGHTLEAKGQKIALHQVPSGILHPEAVGIMDTGMAIHPINLREEIEQIESKLGEPVTDRLVLSENAILLTDLEQAEEQLNRVISGRAKGGTGRGISPAYAHHYDRLGLKVSDLMDDDWREKIGNHYDRYERNLGAYEMDLAHTDVPDFAETKRTGEATNRTIGTKEQFLDRLSQTRDWFINRDLVKNTFLIHGEAVEDLSKGIIFEGAQAVGLHPWLGTRPDVTSSDPTVHGIMPGTSIYRPQDVSERIGVIKLPYTSSVGAREMPTEVKVPKNGLDRSGMTVDQRWASWVRVEASEYGTTTGRARDILRLDFAMIGYNCRMAGIEVLAGTHLDVCQDSHTIKVCTHYTDKSGNVVPYQPGLKYQEGVVPHYVELPGWDGDAASKANSSSELPENAMKFLAFMQRRLGIPIVAVSTGPSRESLVEFPGYKSS